MRIFLTGLSLAAMLSVQTGDHLSQAEVAAALAAKPNVGFVYIEDGGFSTPSMCSAQMPSEAIFTPQGWLNTKAAEAKKQFLPYTPTSDDTAKVLHITSRGCVGSTGAGPECISITRIALLSDKAGKTVVEADDSRPIATSWHNGFGATAACTDLAATFLIEDVQKVRSGTGEFMIATFSGSTMLKIYTVKQKHLKQLGF